MHKTEFLGPVTPGELLTNCRFVTKWHVNEFNYHFYTVLAVLWVAPVASEETLDTQEGGAAVSQGLQTGSQAVGRGRAVSRGAHTGSQAVGRGRAVSRGAHTGSQAVGRGRAVSRGAYTGSQVVGRGRATRGRDQVRAQRHIATVEELLNEREENIDEDKSDIEIEENPLSPHREDVTHAFVHDVGWKKNVSHALCPAATHGYSQHAQFHLYNAAEATEFESCFPDSICCLMTTKGQEQ